MVSYDYPVVGIMSIVCSMSTKCLIMYTKFSFYCYLLIHKYKILKRERSIFDFVPKRFTSEKVCTLDGISAVPRRNSDDFYVLFIAPTNVEREVRSHIDLRDNETFLDVGANVGNYTLSVANDYKDKKVNIIAIEAHPETFNALCTNISCNNFKNVLTINKAVSDHKGIVTMYDQIDLDNRNLRHFRLSSIFERVVRTNVNLQGTSSSEIECDTLDNIIAGHKADLMKMDIEGSEVLALAGANHTLKRLRKVIIEIHDEYNLQQIKNILADYDFKLEIIEDYPKHIIGSK
jgi:FkbM family methyltransferase